MSLIDFIQKIQQKPRYLRIQILCLAVFVCMFFVVSGWVISLKSSFPKTAEKAKTPLDEIKKEIPSFKETLKASIGAFFEKNLEIEDLEDDEENIKQVPEESKEIKPAKLPLSK